MASDMCRLTKRVYCGAFGSKNRIINDIKTWFVGMVWSRTRAEYWTGMGRPCWSGTCRTGLSNYVTVVVVVVRPWCLGEWTNWNGLNKLGIKKCIMLINQEVLIIGKVREWPYWAVTNG